jgi:hypothetical protein
MELGLLVFTIAHIAFVAYETFKCCYIHDTGLSVKDMREWIKYIKHLEHEEARKCFEDETSKACEDARAKLQEARSIVEML